MAPEDADLARADELLHKLMLSMIEFDAGDPARIQHFVKVASLARTIGLGEKLEPSTLLTLEAAAIVHDIGIHPALKKYGRSSGKLQEELGPEPARLMLLGCGFDPHRADRVAFLVGHHHTYDAIDGIDYQVLVEADFIVNLFEDGSGMDAVLAARERIFRTRTGTALLDQMFGL